MRMQILILLSALIHSVSSNGVNIIVTGRLLCNDQPYAYQPIKVYDKNYLFADSLWLEDTTDGEGKFRLSTYVNDFIYEWPVTPYIYIPNYCDAPIMHIIRNHPTQCTQHSMALYVEDRYMSLFQHSPQPGIQWDIPTIELHNNYTTELRGLGSIFGGYLGGTLDCRGVKE